MAKKISDEISDELRKWCESENGTGCGGFVTGYSSEKLCDLADRIDSEMVELPKSADEKIWTGREVCFWTGAMEGDWHKFNGLTYTDGRWCVEDVDFERYPAVSVWYERPDGLERIADELEAWCDRVDVDGDACDKPRALTDRIRRLAAKEDK